MYEIGFQNMWHYEHYDQKKKLVGGVKVFDKSCWKMLGVGRGSAIGFSVKAWLGGYDLYLRLESR